MSNIICALPNNYVLKGKTHQYIKKAVGQGSFGTTYLAEIIPQDGKAIPGLCLTVAIKEFFIKTINGRENGSVTVGNKSGFFYEYKEKFLREANNLAKMSHKNIVNVLEAFEQNNTVYYSMEYIDGKNLDDYISTKGHLAENEAIYVTKEIGSAISHMHSQQMLHLDVKPLNIMRRTDGTLKLIDFGLSKQYDENGEPESSTSVGGGTPGYAPIEQTNYKNGHDFPATMDVYALGATLYKMLVGRRAPVASDILNDGFPISELNEIGISAQTKKAIQAAMQPQKKNRPQTISSFLSLLPVIDNQKWSDVEDIEDKNKEADIDELTELEIVNVERPRKKNDLLYVDSNMSLFCFRYTKVNPNKNDVASYQIEISNKRVKASYRKGPQKEVRKSYFMNSINYNNLLKDINSLQLSMANNSHLKEPINTHIELVITKDNIEYYYSNFDKRKLLLEGDIESLCKIMEKLIHIDNLIIHRDSPIMHKVKYFLFRNRFN